jgi:hypothetical protein
MNEPSVQQKAGGMPASSPEFYSGILEDAHMKLRALGLEFDMEADIVDIQTREKVSDEEIYRRAGVPVPPRLAYPEHRLIEAAEYVEGDEAAKAEAEAKVASAIADAVRWLEAQPDILDVRQHVDEGIYRVRDGVVTRRVTGCVYYERVVRNPDLCAGCLIGFPHGCTAIRAARAMRGR